MVPLRETVGSKGTAPDDLGLPEKPVPLCTRAAAE